MKQTSLTPLSIHIYNFSIELQEGAILVQTAKSVKFAKQLHRARGGYLIQVSASAELEQITTSLIC